MTSQKQLEANRRNAMKSTGPRTVVGKARSSINAVRHGILSRQVLIPGESAAELRDLWQRLREEFQPVGALEDELLDQIVACYWRLRRLRMVEAGLFARGLEMEGIDDGSNDSPEFDAAQYLDALSLSFIRDSHSCNAFGKLSRYETSILRALHRDLHELQRLQAARQGESVQSPIAVDVMIEAASELIHGASE